MLFLSYVLTYRYSRPPKTVTLTVFQHLFRIPDSTFLVAASFCVFFLLPLIFLQLESCLAPSSAGLRVANSSRFGSENLSNSASFLKGIYYCLLNSGLVFTFFLYFKNVVPLFYCFHHFCSQIICCWLMIFLFVFSFQQINYSHSKV